MVNTETCRFCNISNGYFALDGIDEPFASNGKYFAIASIGALVEGWTLIVPKRHEYSMKNSFVDPCFYGFASKICLSLSDIYGPLIVFEHGANSEVSATSCGTSHAHLHILPSDSLAADIMSDGNGAWARCRPQEIKSIAGNLEYLYYSDVINNEVNQTGFLRILENPISQYFRKIIAKKLGLEQVADYRKHPFLETARQTKHILSRYQPRLGV